MEAAREKVLIARRLFGAWYARMLRWENCLFSPKEVIGFGVEQGMMTAKWGSIVLLLVASAQAGSVNDRGRWTSLDKIREVMTNRTAAATAVNLPKVEIKSAEIKGRSVPTRDVSTRPTPGIRDVNTLDRKNVELKRREVSTYETATRPTPVSNFTGKRPAVAEKMRPEPSNTYAVDAAPIPERRIRVNSPEGLEELRRQLNRTP